MNDKWILSGLILTLCLPLLETQGAETHGAFNPQGHWTIRFEDRCSGSTRYSNSAQIVNGSEFVCSSYLQKQNPPGKPLRDELQVQYDVQTQTVTLTGGPSAFPRTLHLDQDKIGVSDVKLFPKTTTEASGCDLDSYVLESVRFMSSNRMQYGYVTVYKFIPHAHQSCAPYLSDLKAAIQRRTATGLLLAMRDINAMNVDGMQHLSTINVFENYDGSRSGHG
jgi:hypothetical protein